MEPDETEFDDHRFWSKVDKSGDCWLWTAYVTKDGYGSFRVGSRRENNRRMVFAHRFSYELLIGSIPEGRQLDHRHTCPKNCVNPEHLRPVTPKQNQENHTGSYRNSASGVRGVRWHENDNKWHARVKHDGQAIHVGCFDTLEDAEAAVIAKRLELFTHNDIDREEGAAVISPDQSSEGWWHRGDTLMEDNFS